LTEITKVKVREDAENSFVPVIKCVYCHIIDKMTKATKILKNLMLFNRGINTVKITALSNNNGINCRFNGLT
jgi:Zn-finger protein